jgi:hypothetical protein
MSNCLLRTKLLKREFFYASGRPSAEAVSQ